ncbi:MAG: hypothetical protein R3D58_17425 [Saprospiraceae bacterium]
MNAQEKQQFLEHWKTTRQKGAFRYVLATAISWGTLTAFLVRFFMTVIEQGFSWTALRGAYNSREFLLYWGVFLIGGLFYAVTMWFYFNWQYRKLEAAQQLRDKEQETDSQSV